MLNRFKLVYRLFKFSFLFVSILYFVSILILLSIVSLKEGYKTSLEDEFATKQPHIKIEFIDDNIYKNTNQIKKEINQIKSISPKIDKISTFVTGEKFFRVNASKIFNGNASYTGNIKIIGLGQEQLVYDFFSCNFVKRDPLGIPYSPLEFLYILKTQNNIVIFNNSLYSSFFPVLESVENISLENETNRYKGKLASIFNDYDKKPILYTSITFANKLLGNKPNHISGYYVDAKNLDEIDNLKELLKLKLSKTKYIISSWLENRKKQSDIFSLLQTISSAIVFVILLLSILFILLLIYYAIVKKSYQLSVLFSIGYGLKKEIFLSISFIIIFFSILSFGVTFWLSQYIANEFNLQISAKILYNNIYYILFIDIIAIVMSYILINNSYKLKAKSLF